MTCITNCRPIPSPERNNLDGSVSFFPGPGEGYRAAEVEADGEGQGRRQGDGVGPQGWVHPSEEQVTRGQRCCCRPRPAHLLRTPVRPENAAGDGNSSTNNNNKTIVYKAQ